MKKTFLLQSLKSRLLLLSLLFLFSSSAWAQDSTKSKEAKKEVAPKKGDIYVSALPILGSNPAFGFIYGAGVAGSSYLGDPSNTSLSSVLGGVAFTSKKQTIITIKSSAFTSSNKFILIGDWRYLISSQPTWGLGSGPQSAKLVSNGFEFNDGSFSNGISEAQMLKFNFVRFYETGLKNVAKNVYVGVGLHYDSYSSIEDPLLNLDTAGGAIPSISSFYAYNSKYGFSQTNSTVVGISINGIYDSRDNQNNPYKGRYAYLSFKMNPEFMGSEKGSTSLWLEYRDYLDLSKDHHNMLGFWTWGNFTTSGNLPYLLLPAIGNDQFAKSGRPYAQGRFRGENMYYAETEFRRHLYGTKNNPDFLGMVGFVNILTANANESKIDLFDYINKGYGLGLRVNINKKARTNLGFDYGWGDYGTSGFYLRLNETF